VDGDARRGLPYTADMRPYLAPPAAGPATPAPAPTFSVLIPAYQAAATIGETLESAFAQTLPPHEVIVCDDGSTDDLDAALAPFRDRIVLLRKANSGVASARNTALRAASGEFVAQLDSDDAFLPDRLKALAELATERPDLDILATDAYFEFEGKVVGRFYDAQMPFPTEDQRTAIFDRCFVGWPAVRRRRLLAVGGFDESLVTGDDWDAWMRLILDGARAGVVNEALLRYRLTPGSVSSDRVRVLRERVAILDKTAQHPTLTPSERQALASARRSMHHRALFAEAHEALLARRPDARRRALALVVGRGLDFRTRIKALAAALAPGAARRALERRDLGGRSRMKRPIPQANRGASG
jgi:GT2 family glycosyltransferase